MQTKSILKASVVIINKSERSVDETLAALVPQLKASAAELLVVDASLGKLDDIYKKYPGLTVLPFTSKTTKKVTIPEQRNVGIRASKAAIIVFIDAGCIPAKDWLKNIIKPITAQHELIVAGATLSTGSPTFHDVVHEANKDSTYIRQAPTINLAIARHVFDNIGYFDENLLYGSDFDFTWRVNKAGIKIYNAVNATMTHDWGGFRQEIKRARRYGQAKTKLYRKHKPGWRVFLRDEFALVFYAGFIIGLPLALISPLYLIIILVPLLKNSTAHGKRLLVIINLVTAFSALREYVSPERV